MVAKYPPEVRCQEKNTPPGPWGEAKVNSCLLLDISKISSTQNVSLSQLETASEPNCDEARLAQLRSFHSPVFGSSCRPAWFECHGLGRLSLKLQPSEAFLFTTFSEVSDFFTAGQVGIFNRAAFPQIPRRATSVNFVAPWFSGRRTGELRESTKLML